MIIIYCNSSAWSSHVVGVNVSFLDLQKSSQFVDFKDMCRAFEETLRHEDHVIMTDTSTNLVWMETFITTLDHLDLYTHR